MYISMDDCRPMRLSFVPRAFTKQAVRWILGCVVVGMPHSYQYAAVHDEVPSPGGVAPQVFDQRRVAAVRITRSGLSASRGQSPESVQRFLVGPAELVEDRSVRLRHEPELRCEPQQPDGRTLNLDSRERAPR